MLVEVDPEAGPADGSRGRGRGRVPRDFPLLCPSCIRPSLAAAGGSLWAIDPGSRDVLQIDATRAVVVGRIPIAARYLSPPGRELWTLGAGEITRGLRRAILFGRLDVLTGAVAQTRTPPARSGVGVTELALGRTSIWTAEWSPSRFSPALPYEDGHGQPTGG